MKQPRLHLTVTPQVKEALEKLLWTGLFGNNLTEVAYTLLCEAVREQLRVGMLTMDDIKEMGT